MSESHRPLTWLDVFTSTPLTGNQLAVVHDADGLDDETMLGFARETKLSETTFVQAGDAECDYRNRIFWPNGEMPMAGHPSLGTAVAVAHRAGARTAHYVQRTPAGLQPVDVELDGRVGRASMLQEPAEIGDELTAGPLLAALGLGAGDGDPELPPVAASTGLRHVLLPLRDGAALERARARPDDLEPLLEEFGAATLYAAVCDAGAARADARAFFVTPGRIPQEDPATGSAAGPLLAYLRERRGLESLTIDQGVQMGRASRLDAAWEGDRPRVGGDVVVLAEGTVSLP